MLSAQAIEENPSLATESELEVQLRSLIKVAERGGKDLGGYDAGLQSYYEKLYYVQRNEVVFRAVEVIARHNPAALSEKNRELVRQLGAEQIEHQATESSLDPETNYQSDLDNLQEARDQRESILKEVLALFTSA